MFAVHQSQTATDESHPTGFSSGAAKPQGKYYQTLDLLMNNEILKLHF